MVFFTLEQLLAVEEDMLREAVKRGEETLSAPRAIDVANAMNAARARIAELERELHEANDQISTMISKVDALDDLIARLDEVRDEMLELKRVAFEGGFKGVKTP